MPSGNCTLYVSRFMLWKFETGSFGELSCHDSIFQNSIPNGLNHFAAKRASSRFSFEPAVSKYVFQLSQPVGAWGERSRFGVRQFGTQRDLYQSLTILTDIAFAVASSIASRADTNHFPLSTLNFKLFNCSASSVEGEKRASSSSDTASLLLTDKTLSLSLGVSEQG